MSYVDKLGIGIKHKLMIVGSARTGKSVVIRDIIKHIEDINRLNGEQIGMQVISNKDEEYGGVKSLYGVTVEEVDMYAKALDSIINKRVEYINDNFDESDVEVLPKLYVFLDGVRGISYKLDSIIRDNEDILRILNIFVVVTRTPESKALTPLDELVYDLTLKLGPIKHEDILGGMTINLKVGQGVLFEVDGSTIVTVFEQKLKN